MRTQEKSKNKQKAADNSANQKNNISRSITPNKDANTSKLRINQSGQSKLRRSVSKDASKNHDFIGYVDVMTDDLNHKKEKMEACIDLFNLMHSNNMQLRCLTHNNVLTLYCLTERRILCVNCTYGVTKHRTHKVLPLKDANTQVSQDNILLREIIDNDLKILEDSLRNSQENSYVLQREMKRVLEQFEQNYQRTFEELKQRYEREKERIKKGFESIINKTRNLEKSIEEFKFKIWETLSKIGIGKRNESTTNETQVVRQVFCVSLSELTRLQIRRITKRELQRMLTRLHQ